MQLFLILALMFSNGWSKLPLKSNNYVMGSVVPSRYTSFNTITTEHFNIHYPTHSSEQFFASKNMELIARLTATYLEEGFEKLTKDLNSKPYLRIQVVIVDNTDSHNGFATPVPQNTIYIYAIPPLGHTTIGEYDNWLRDTAFHELTHIISLSATRGYSSVLRPIFGTVVSMNGLAPLNMIEGYTVFEETNMTTKGRGRSTFLHTMMRTTAYEKTLNSDSLYSLSRAPYVIDRWPMGNVPYLYGYLLMEHVAKKYSLDVPGKISKHNPGVIPYYPSLSFDKYTGKDIPELWEEMLEEKRQFYAKWIEYINKDKVTKIEPKTNEGFVNRTPALSPDGKYLAYYVINPNKSNRITVLDISINKELTSIKTDDTTFIKWIDNSTILFNSPNSEIGSSYFNLQTYDVIKKKSISLDNSDRVIYAHPINNSEFCTVRAVTGKFQLNIEKAENKKLKLIKTVYNSQYLGRLSSPICSFKNNAFESYVIEKDIDKNEQIIKIDLSGNKTVIHESSGSIRGFTFNNDKIVLIDDKDGIFNLYSLDLSNKKLTKLTNLISGAFDVELGKTNDKRFYITYYTSDGFRIGEVIADYNYSEGKNKFDIDNLPIRDKQSRAVAEMDKGTYWSFKSLLPKLWVPSFSFVDGGYVVGGITYGADSLFQHQYFVSGAYDSRTKAPILGATYTNQSFYPIFNISAYNDNTWYSNDEIIQDFVTDISVGVPLDTYWVILAGIDYDYRTLDFLGTRTKRFGVYGGVAFGDTSATISAISNPEEGVTGYLKYSISPQKMDSTYSEYEIDSNLKFYIPMWWDGHVIAINNNASYSYGNPYMFFVAGGEQGSLVFFSKKYLLRGYPVSYFTTRSLMISNLEYRFPIVTIHSGYGLFPLFIKKIHGAIISDNGFLGKNFKNDFHSYGFELRTDAQIFYHIPITLRLGLYKGTDYAKGQFFVGVSTIIF